MGKFTNFIAGPGLYDLPGHVVEAVMFNYPQNWGSPGKISGTRRILEVAKPTYVFLDSGGFQKLTAESHETDIKTETITPEKIVEAAAQLKPTAMMALDAPIRKLKGDEDREQEFRNKLERNVLWAIETAALRQKMCPDVGLFIPVQCYSLRQLDEFMRAIEGIQFTGVGLPIRVMSLSDVALFLLRFHQLGIQNVHLLGVAAFFPMALAAYFSRHSFEWVSLDAKTWKDRAMHNGFLSPHDLSNVEINERVIIPDDTVFDCACTFCRSRTFSYFKHLPYTDRAMLLRCHNYFVTKKAARDLHQNAGSISALYNHLLQRTLRRDRVEELCRVLEMVEALKDQDLGDYPLGRQLRGLQGGIKNEQRFF